MSGSGSDKTEKPTPRRIQQAREEGQVAKSQDFNGAVVLGTATALMAFVGPATYQTLHAITVQWLTQLAHKPLTSQGFNSLFSNTLQGILLLLLPLLLGILALSVLSNLVQVKPLFTVKPLMPKWEKVNPISGFKRMWSMRAVMEVVKASIKMLVVGVAVGSIILAHKDELLGLGGVDIAVSSGFVFRVLGEVAFWTVVILLVVGAGDWWFQAHQLNKQLRMTRQEIKDERRNMDGDPMIKSRIRQVGMQMVRKRQLASVPLADVVVTNPTHFAVAIQYDPDVSPAPRVVAKGQDHFALKIREAAKEAGVPIVENKPLARSLHASVEVDHMIPPELFVTVAEVLAYVYSRNKGRRKLKTKSKTPNRVRNIQAPDVRMQAE